MEIELERTFLAKYIPEGLEKCEFKEILDIYIPLEAIHPNLRIRKRGDIYEITKKELIHGDDSSELSEKTIPLNEEEFKSFSQLAGKRLHKNRYFYPYEKRIAEIDVFLDDLAGLVVVDFEFSTREVMEKFKMPDFCLAEITQDKSMAGGMLTGKSYLDIEKDLAKYNYKKL